MSRGADRTDSRTLQERDLLYARREYRSIGDRGRAVLPKPAETGAEHITGRVAPGR